ncbi:DUF1592 domain-containing protein [Zavarzinella formosa]|uniref:DUF1592 domain-containing protein n=1 Tax=Zavarzinella formosa TaxID=360055 RepID=UPI0002EBBFE0|nr:DUF1592 domain-containing protein [Zavarzinella formosa]
MPCCLPAVANHLRLISGMMRAGLVPVFAGSLFAMMFHGVHSDLRAADPFQDKVLPFLKTYCIQCHNEKTKSGELDLTRFNSSAKVAEEFRQWEHVVTFIKKQEMPPAKAKQPSADGRAEALAALEQTILTEARKQAGDPGVVPPRRLSNAEYDHTIHDLTGVDVRPAKTFPVDPASGEGFNNTGEALTMSPSLFKKYYAAAELVADHALISSSGVGFAPHPVVTFADRQKFYEQAIIRFYEQHTVDYEKCFTALWLYRHRPAARKEVTVEAWATEAGLSPKYLRSLWNTLQGDSPDNFLILWLRQRWNALPAPTNPMTPAVTAELQTTVRTLASDIRQLSLKVCPPETEAIVSNAGNAPIDHLARRRRTAESRDTFDTAGTSRQLQTVTFKNITDKDTIKLVIQLADVAGKKADGLVILSGILRTNDQTTDGKRKWSLRELLLERTPDVAASLKFGAHPSGGKLDADAFALKAPATLELTLPAKAFSFKTKGTVALTADCRLDAATPGFTMIHVLDRKPAADELGLPMIDAKHPAAASVAASGETFCHLFPNRFFYVDSTRGLSAGFHLIEGFFRDDQPLCRSVLSAPERKELDRLWDELYFCTGIWEKMIRGFVFFERSERNFLKHVDFDGFREEDPELTKDETLARFKEVYLKRSGVKATGDELAKHPISIFFEDVRGGIRRRAETLKRLEPMCLKDLLVFAEKAYRRPLTQAEQQKIEKFFGDVCQDKEQGVEAAMRASIVRILVSPHFCMHFVATPSGDSVASLPDLALASRLSYFIWSGPPDAELLALAKTGKLKDAAVIRGQVRRMLKDPKVSRFAEEFFGQWLGYRDFPTQEAVNRQAFPAFDDALKQAMFEEPTRLITHLIQQDRPITELLNSDTTFVNKKLASHYGLPFRGSADEWEAVNGLHQQGRGGVLGMAVFLTKNSQPQRTSPVKRGFWVVHKLLGEHIPPPPPDVAVLPAKETDTNGKTIRELMKLHVDDMKCARCHVRFDPVGLAMEGFDPIGRSRAKDLAGRKIDNAVSLPTGKEVRGVAEFGDYLATHRKQDFTKTLCQKFLGYALGRSLQLPDQPLLDKMQADLAATDDKLSTLFELVATSPQFRNQRCKDFTPAKFKTEPLSGEK